MRHRRRRSRGPMANPARSPESSREVASASTTNSDRSSTSPARARPSCRGQASLPTRDGAVRFLRRKSSEPRLPVRVQSSESPRRSGPCASTTHSNRCPAREIRTRSPPEDRASSSTAGPAAEPLCRGAPPASAGGLLRCLRWDPSRACRPWAPRPNVEPFVFFLRAPDGGNPASRLVHRRRNGPQVQNLRKR
jgi:hypothetical protein